MHSLSCTHAIAACAGSVESYYFDVIMSFPEEQREALARRLHSSATGSGLRLGLRWDARYVLILASRPALTCNVCYGPRRTQVETKSEDLYEHFNEILSVVTKPIRCYI